MTKEEALNILNNASVYHPYYLDALNTAIEALEKEPQWIPVEEGLPSEIDGCKVLGCNRLGFMMIGYLCKDTTGDFGDTGYFIDAPSDYLENIVAWQPLPKPYEKPKQILKEADKSGLEFADMPTLKEG